MSSFSKSFSANFRLFYLFSESSAYESPSDIGKDHFFYLFSYVNNQSINNKQDWIIRSKDWKFIISNIRSYFIKIKKFLRNISSNIITNLRATLNSGTTIFDIYFRNVFSISSESSRWELILAFLWIFTLFLCTVCYFFKSSSGNFPLE